MTAANCVLGVDGGASKTVAVIARFDGTIIGAGRSGNADIYTSEDAEFEVKKAIEQALAQAVVEPQCIEAAVLSLVGVDWPEDVVHWCDARQVLGLGHLPDNRLSVVNDGIGGLWSLCETGAAVAVVCGTGAAVSARGETGETWHSSFWQRTQGAVELTRKALDAVYLADLGIGPATALTSAALTHFDVADVAALLHSFTARNVPKVRNIGGFAPRLIAAADAGDQVARSIVLDHADRLGKSAVAAAHKVGIDRQSPSALILAGGVFQSKSRLMSDHIAHIFRDYFPHARPMHGQIAPVAGAVTLALQLVGTVQSHQLHDRILATLPKDPFFRTNPLPVTE